MPKNGDRPTGIADAALSFNDPPSIVWLSVQEANDLLWVENPKLHDLGAVCESIKLHGFQELPKFDKNLPNVRGKMGAIKAGNGRIEALEQMEKSGRYALPRGLAQDDSGRWALPMLVGTDAETVNLARSYAVDSNNLVMSGGDFTGMDMARLWDIPALIPLLSDLAGSGDAPISLGTEIDSVLAALQNQSGEINFNDYNDQNDKAIYYRVIIPKLSLAQANQIVTDFDGARVEQYRE